MRVVALLASAALACGHSDSDSRSGGDCFAWNVDYQGSDIRYRHAYNAHECQSHCAYEHACSLFSFQPSTGACWLKHQGAASRTRQHGDRVSGPKHCGAGSAGHGGHGGYAGHGGGGCYRHDVDYHGSDLRKSHAHSATDCQAQCSHEYACSLFTFRPSSGECWLKHPGAAHGERHHGDRVSGPKHCGGGGQGGYAGNAGGGGHGGQGGYASHGGGGGYGGHGGQPGYAGHGGQGGYAGSGGQGGYVDHGGQPAYAGHGGQGGYAGMYGNDPFSFGLLEEESPPSAAPHIVILGQLGLEEEAQLEVPGGNATCYKVFLATDPVTAPASERTADAKAFAHVVAVGDQGEGEASVLVKLAWWYLPSVTAASPVLEMCIHSGDVGTHGGLLVGLCGQDPFPAFTGKCSQAKFLQNQETLVEGEQVTDAVQKLRGNSEEHKDFYLQLHLGGPDKIRGQLQPVPCQS